MGLTNCENIPASESLRPSAAWAYAEPMADGGVELRFSVREGDSRHVFRFTKEDAERFSSAIVAATKGQKARGSLRIADEP